MSVITYEQMMAMFAETREQIEISRKEADLRAERFDKQMAELGNRIGQIIESMVEGGVVRLFQELGYEFTRYCRHLEFENKKLGVAGEIDLFLENGEYACLVEVKTNLSVDDVKDHIERLRKFRLDSDTRGDKRRFIAAVGGGVVLQEVRTYALKQGFYVIQQSGDNVEVISPEGKPREW